ncbi:hypothetical protein ACIOML_22395 [Streptomyces anulatus]
MPVRLVITDAMWDRIEPLIPADPVRGRRWADHRRTLEAIAAGPSPRTTPSAALVVA